jgi:hypothetical protein
MVRRPIPLTDDERTVLERIRDELTWRDESPAVAFRDRPGPGLTQAGVAELLSDLGFGIYRGSRDTTYAEIIVTGQGSFSLAPKLIAWDALLRGECRIEPADPDTRWTRPTLFAQSPDGRLEVEAKAREVHKLREELARAEAALADLEAKDVE